MATPSQVAMLPVCDLCEAKDSRWFCDDCLINLCEKCKVIYQRGPKTKNDNIIPIGQVQQGTQGKLVPVLCDLHKTKLCELYCRKCEQLICAQCLSSSHNTHGCDSVESLVNKKVTELDDIQQNFKKKLKSHDTAFASESEEHADYMFHIDKLKEDVKGQTDKIVTIFYKLRDNQLSDLSYLQKVEEGRYQFVSNNYQSRINDMRKYVEFAQKAQVSGNAAILIKAVKESTQSYQSLEDMHVSKLPRPEFEHDETPEEPLFLQLQGRLNLPAMKVEKSQKPRVPSPQTEARLSKRDVDLSNVKIKLTIQIKDKTGCVKAVIPSDNNMAWIALHPDKYLSLVDTKGRVVKKSVEVDDEILYAVSYDGDILVVYMKGDRVMRFSKDGDSVTVFSNLSPFYTTGLCATSQQDVLVSLISSLTLRTLASKVVRLNRYGKVIQEIEYINQEPIFSSAKSLTSLPSGDLVVSDRIAKESYRIIFIDGSGDHRYIWNGGLAEGRKVQNFYPVRVTHGDQKVYITDIKDHCVYVLDRHGKAEQFMLDKLGIKYPLAISIDDGGRMWIGCDAAVIYVLE